MNAASADTINSHQDRTYAITGAASGIGAATAGYLRQRGARVIACDLHDADVVADLTTGEGRAALIAGVTRLSGGRLDAIVANAGGGPTETMLSLNFFGAVATLEGLRPLLGASPAPRAVVVSSIASLAPIDPGLHRSLSRRRRKCCERRCRGGARRRQEAFGPVRQRQACIELLVSKGRRQTAMGRPESR